MSKSVEFEDAPNNRVRLVMTERGYADRIVSKKQFTVQRWQLEQALKSAGFYQTVNVDTTETEAAKLQAEALLYNGLAMLNTTDYGKKVKNELFDRLTKKLDLPKS